ncbi:unnamed protein product, partial [Musa acuminata subsp. malaccensis]
TSPSHLFKALLHTPSSQSTSSTYTQQPPHIPRHLRRSAKTREMAKKAFQVGLALAVMTIVLSGLASAQSGCTTTIISLAPCLNYITGNSSTPSSSCCSQLASVVQSQPACLCSVLNGGASSFGITINQTRALAMPAACNVQTPPVSECNSVAGGPEKSPTASPATPATPVPSTPSSPKSEYLWLLVLNGAEGGSKATPATTSDGSSYKSSRSLMLSILFLAGCVSFTGL